MPEPPPGQLPVSGNDGREPTIICKRSAPRSCVAECLMRMTTSESAQVADRRSADWRIDIFPGQDPIGKRIRLTTDDNGPEMAHDRRRRAASESLRIRGSTFRLAASSLCRCRNQPQTGLVMLLRTSSPAEPWRSRCGKSSRRSIRRNRFSKFRTMQQRVEETWATPRLITFLLSAFAALALVLAVVGLVWRDGL